MESNSGGSRDSGVPTTILQDTSIATESRSNYQQVLTSNFNDLQFEGIIGQGRFSTVWKCTTNTKVSFLKIKKITNKGLCKVGQVFPVVISSEFCMEQYRDDDYREDAL